MDINWVQDSPLDLGKSDILPLSLPPLIWMESNKIPIETTITNTGYMLNVQSEYSGQRPSLTGSLLRCPYEFWCYHFHWGTKADDGSEHSIKGKRFPMEIHLVFYNTSYSSTDNAMNGNDGLLILVYMCKLESKENSILKKITSNLVKIKKSGKSTNIDPYALSSLFDCNLNNYLMYWGAIEDDQTKPILWMFSSKPVSINVSQLSSLRSLRGPDDKCISFNCRTTRSTQRCKVYNVSQPMCTVKSLLNNVEANIKLSISAPNRSDTVARTTMEKQHTMADNKRNFVSTTGELALGYVSPPIVDKSTVANNIKSRKKITSDSREIPYDLEDQPNEPDEANTKPDKHTVKRSIDKLLADLTNYSINRGIDNRKKVTKTHREGIRMNATALMREMHIKDQQQKVFELKNKNI